jgi:hypothetical protein
VDVPIPPEGTMQEEWTKGIAFEIVDRRSATVSMNPAMLVVCDPRRNDYLKQGSKSDRIDARKLRDMRLQQVIQPRRPSAFFKRHIQAPAQSMHELNNRYTSCFP